MQLAGGSARQGNRRTQCSTVSVRSRRRGLSRGRRRAGRGAAGRLCQRSDSDGRRTARQRRRATARARRPDRRHLRRLRLQAGRPLRRVQKLHPNISIKENVTDPNESVLAQTLTRLHGQQRHRRHPGRSRSATSPRSSSTQADKFVDLGKASSVDKSQLAGLEVAAGHHQGRQDDRPRHGHRPDGDLLPQGPVQEGRPATTDRTKVAAQWAGDWAEVRRRRQAVHEEGAQRHQVHGLRPLGSQRGRSAARASSTTTRPARSSRDQARA